MSIFARKGGHGSGRRVLGMAHVTMGPRGRTVGVAPGTITLSLGGLGGFRCLNGTCPPDPVGWYYDPFAVGAPASMQTPAAAGVVVTHPAIHERLYKIYGSQAALAGTDDMPGAPMRWDLVWKMGLGVLAVGLGLGYFASRK